MPTMIQLADPTDSAFRTALVTLWNTAYGRDWAISPALAIFNTHAAQGVTRSAWLAHEGEQPVGFVLANVWSGNLALGWVDAIAVAPEWQRFGIGSALLGHAEAWLGEQGYRQARLGGGLRPFAPGLPLASASTAHSPSPTVDWFKRRGYVGERIEIDLARNLADYQTPAGVTSTVDVRPLADGESNALFEFFARTFPGRWEYEVHEHFRAGGPAHDFLALWQNESIEGFCYTSVAGSFRPLDRFYMGRLPKPWGQLGPLGLSRERRGQGAGIALIDAALRHLQARGVQGCVIDWTTLVELYGKFGFVPFHRYAVLIKELNS